MSPLSRKFDQAGKKTIPDGVIRFEVINASHLNWRHCRFSPEVVVKGVPWTASVRLDDYLCITLVSRNTKHPTQWSIDLDAEYTLIHPDNSNNITIEKHEHYYYENGPNRQKYWGTVFAPMTEDELFRNKGFLKCDTILVEIRFWISNMKGFRFPYEFDFSDCNEPYHDGTLVIEGEKIHVSKKILAAHSLVFKSMFYDDGLENNIEEIEISDVDRKDFIELLLVICPPNKMITHYSAELLLKLCKQFQMEGLVKRVEEALIATYSVYDAYMKIKKLRFADEYKLFALQEHCLSLLNVEKDFKALERERDYRNLSDEMKAAILARQLEISM